MVSDIKYNMNDIEDMRTSMEILEDDIQENDVMIARIDANVEAIKDALNVVTTNHAKR
jgi:hypothetical protein